MTENLILATDAYKLTHHLQYPTNITKLYSSVTMTFLKKNSFCLSKKVFKSLLPPPTPAASRMEQQAEPPPTHCFSPEPTPSPFS